MILLASAIALTGTPSGVGASSNRLSPAASLDRIAPTTVYPFLPNVKVTDESSPYKYQVEPTMVINRSGTVFAGWKETDGPDAAGFRVGSSYSIDQGQTWAPNILMNQTHPNLGCRDSDPWMARDSSDRVHFAYLEYDPGGGSSPPCNSGLDVSNTTNGQDWGTVHYIQGHGGLVDKDSIAFDANSRLYATWDEGNVLAFTWSDDFGGTWAPIINPGNRASVLGAIVDTVGNNTVYLTWWDFSSSDILFESSTDGGNTWSSVIRVNDRAGSASGGFPQYPLPAMNVDKRTGAVYVSWADSRNGNPDIYFTNSTDGGKTWGTNHRINDNTDSSQQYMVDLAVDSTGKVHAAWEDRRNGNWNIFYSNSTDGGQTWNTNVRVSSEDTPGTLDRPGDYFALEAGPNDYIYVVWTDGRGPDYDIYYARNPGFPVATVTATTSPVGLPVTVDGVTSPSPVQFNWTIGSSHTLGVAATIPVGSGTRYAWDSWSDGGAITHTIVATADGTFTASFVKQFQATVGQDPAGLSVLVDDVSYTSPASFWWNDSSTHSLDAPSPQYATPDVRSVFSSWSDGGAQAHTVTASAPLSATATFVQEQGFRVTTAPGNLSFKVDGTDYSAATTFWFAPGTYHIVSVETLQSGATGVRYRFASWSDGGAATHVVHFVSAMTIQATFAPEYYLTVTSSVPGASGSGWFAAGSTATASVVNPIYSTGPGQRSVFRGWAGDATGTGLTSNPILMDRPKEAVADYGTQFYLDVGSAYATASGAGWYDPGTTAYASISATTVSLAIGTRAAFDHWTDGASGTGATSNAIVMDATKVATAVWKTQYLLTIDSGPGASASGGWYDSGTTVVARLSSGTVPLSAGARSQFLQWVGDAAGNDPSGSSAVVMDRPRNVGTRWTTEYLVTVTSDVGSVEGGGWYAAGSQATLRAPADQTSGGQSYSFSGWTGDVTSKETSVTVTVDHPMSARATYSSTTILGGVSGTTAGLISVLVVIAVVVALVVWRRSRRRGE